MKVKYLTTHIPMHIKRQTCPMLNIFAKLSSLAFWRTVLSIFPLKSRESSKIETEVPGRKLISIQRNSVPRYIRRNVILVKWKNHLCANFFFHKKISMEISYSQKSTKFGQREKSLQELQTTDFIQLFLQQKLEAIYLGRWFIGLPMNT